MMYFQPELVNFAYIYIYGGKVTGLITLDPSLRAASSLLDFISFRILVREYCAASSSCSEGTPLIIYFVYQKPIQARISAQGKNKRNIRTEIEK